MHPTAETGFTRMLRKAQATGGPVIRDVLDIGGADVNGVVHRALPPTVERLDVLDIAEGPGVTMVGDASSVEFWEGLHASGRRYDLVISTETLEHVERWWAIVLNVPSVLTLGGWFVGTCASTGRRPHGARGAHDPAPLEYYGNIEPSDLIGRMLVTFGGDVVVEYSRRPTFPTTSDLYWRAQVVTA